ncbi:MAG: hypothetical protein NTZ16_14545, partial [Verrucomicrobia bacterium]|nr:hypothetical protein [Verrucomicrobiota bacterium]
MNKPITNPALSGLLSGGFLLLPLLVWLPATRAEEPRWLTLGPPEARVGMDVDSFTEEISSGAGSASYEHLALTPLVGLRAQGSIYHPNLLTFLLDGEAGWGWDSISTKSAGTSVSRDESQEVQRYLVQLNFLATKPYNATFLAARDHTYRDYGTFSTFTVDSSRYGGHVGWTTDSLSLNVDAGVRDEKATGLTSSSEISETYFNFTGLQRRQFGQTSVFCRYNEFENTLGLGSRQTSMSYAVGGSDTEIFGSRRHITATTAASYSHSEYSGQQAETVTANENITINHRPRLDSYLSADFSHSSYGSVSAARLQGVCGVRHQLYESLTSQLDAHGSYDDSSGPGSSSVNDRYGVGINENYTKRLGSWGRLGIGLGTVVDHQDFDSSGSVLPVFDEPHNLTNPPVFLNNPRVVTGSVQVRAAGDGFLYTEGVDYTLNVVGELTQILPVLPLTADVGIHGSDVLVDYQSASLYNASFDSFGASAQIRLDLFRRFGLYARLNWQDNNAPPTVLTQSLTDLVAGADY